jgi:hypothetical protein
MGCFLDFCGFCEMSVHLHQPAPEPSGQKHQFPERFWIVGVDY